MLRSGQGTTKLQDIPSKMLEASTVTKVNDTNTKIGKVDLSDLQKVAVSQMFRNKVFAQSEGYFNVGEDLVGKSRDHDFMWFKL